MAAFWDTDGTFKQIDPTGAVTAIGGGGGGSGFSSDVQVQIPNDAGVPVTASEWITTLDAGTSQVNIRTQHGGAPVPHYIGSSNLAGAQTVTTSGATPTVAWTVGSDMLVMTLGNDTTSITVTGLNESVDRCYGVRGQTVNGAAVVSLKPNGTAGPNSNGFYEQHTDLTLHGATTAGAVWMDADTASVKGTTDAVLCGTALGRSFTVTMTTQTGGAGFTEWYQSMDATSAGTTPMTSLVISGALKASSVIFLSKLRPTSE